jgi:hypothetical protein
MGGDFAAKALFFPEDRVAIGEEIHYDELFDEPRVVVRVIPILASGEVMHWEADIMPRSAWNLRGGPNQLRRFGDFNPLLAGTFIPPAEDPKHSSGQPSASGPASQEPGQSQDTGAAPETSDRAAQRAIDAAPAAPVPSTHSTTTAKVRDDFDFTSEAGRNKAVADYTKRWTTGQWTCSEASLARTAVVDKADLSKWKKGLLPPESDKKARIETALKNNDPPTPPARPESGA